MNANAKVTLNLADYNELVAKLSQYENAVQVTHSRSDWNDSITDYIEIEVDLKPFKAIVSEQIRDNVPISMQAKFEESGSAERFRNGRLGERISTTLFTDSRKKDVVEIPPEE